MVFVRDEGCLQNASSLQCHPIEECNYSWQVSHEENRQRAVFTSTALPRTQTQRLSAEVWFDFNCTFKQTLLHKFNKSAEVFFSPLCPDAFSPPASRIPLLFVHLHPHCLSLHTHSFIALQCFRVDPSQRLLFIFAFSSPTNCVCADYVHLFVCVPGDDVIF